ncbi:PIN domain-containing protein [Paraburkholderia sp. EG286A]|uniref:PIN domain-containing protein n=1 Tax=Paraburkholderia sp. EG286A TaxID=3237014 RepID=UPI0034D29608
MNIEDFDNKAAAEALSDCELLQAIAIDTNIYDGLKGFFEGRMLKQLEQFSRKEPVELLMPEVVYEETLRHAATRATESARDLRKTLKDAGFGLGLARDVQDRVLEVALGGLQADELAKSRFDSFIESTGTTVLSPASLVDAAELQRRYFESEAPFSEAGDKKAEFPDAIALLSLEGWADKHDKNVLVVSHDNDWKNFCAGSRRLHIIGDLAHAIGLFQHVTAASNFASSLEEWAETNGDWARVESAVEDALWGMSITVDANSEYSFEDEVIDRVLLGAEVGDEATVISAGAEEWVIEVPLVLNLEIEVSFSFYLRDGIDKDCVAIGGTRVKEKRAIASSAILTFWPLEDEGVPPELSDVEIMATSIYIDCDYVGPSI